MQDFPSELFGLGCLAMKGPVIQGVTFMATERTLLVRDMVPSQEKAGRVPQSPRDKVCGCALFAVG